MPNILQVIHEIRNLNDTSIERWIVSGLTSLTPELLEDSIREWRDPLTLVEFLNLENPLVKHAARLVLKTYWERAEHILTDPWELYNQIARDPKKKELLDTVRGREWLTYVRIRCENYFFNYTWN